jgi:predicted dinucleotide-binding enzyme
MTHKTVVLEKIESKTTRVGIIGLGYVGLPLALRFLEAGYRWKTSCAASTSPWSTS